MNNIQLKDFDLAKTLQGGQTFRFHNHDKGFIVITQKKIFFVSQENNSLFYDGCEESFVKHYFNLDYPIDEFYKQIQTNALFEDVRERARGIRILRQDVWETILTFLLSQNANMKKIRHNLESLSKKFGTKVHYKGEEFFLTPPLGSLNDQHAIINSSVGYRSQYIYAVNHLLTPLWLQRLQTATYDEAKNRLLDIPGIGPKVAECICLYGLQHYESFPIDVWVKRAVEDLYFKGKEQTIPTIQVFAQKTFGKHRGMVQQYLFEWRRHKPHMNKKNR